MEVSALTAGGGTTVCGFYKGAAKTRQVIDNHCPHGTMGQMVKVQITIGIQTYLQLCEVEIYAI
jgi:hypothetical protein